MRIRGRAVSWQVACMTIGLFGFILAFTAKPIIGLVSSGDTPHVLAGLGMIGIFGLCLAMFYTMLSKMNRQINRRMGKY